MDIGRGRQGPSTALLTREVRWFHPGPLPSEVRDWFTTDEHQIEDRTDHYDLASARNGVGRKHRSDTSLDTKFWVEVFPSLPLAPGLTGEVQDWMKIRAPLGSSSDQSLIEPFSISKSLITRRFPIWGDDDSGCEAELADIEAGGVRAWSLCFETYGAPERRSDALVRGVRLVTGTPLPTGVEFADDASLSYPAWIVRMAHQRT